MTTDAKKIRLLDQAQKLLKAIDGDLVDVVNTLRATGMDISDEETIIVEVSEDLERVQMIIANAKSTIRQLGRIK